MNVNSVHTFSQLSMTSSCTCFLYVKPYTNEDTMVHKHIEYYQALTDILFIICSRIYTRIFFLIVPMNTFGILTRHTMGQQRIKTNYGFSGTIFKKKLNGDERIPCIEHIRKVSLTFTGCLIPCFYFDTQFLDCVGESGKERVRMKGDWGERL